MKEPKKISMAMGVGMAIVSALDVIISISLLLSTSTGKMADLNVARIIVQIANICVAVGILGIINGVSIYSARYYQDLIIHNEIPFSRFLKIHSHSDRPIMGTLVSFILTIFWFIIFTVVGVFFINSGHYGAIPG
jgi:amino acid transporter